MLHYQLLVNSFCTVSEDPIPGWTWDVEAQMPVCSYPVSVGPTALEPWPGSLMSTLGYPCILTD